LLAATQDLIGTCHFGVIRQRCVSYVIDTSVRTSVNNFGRNRQCHFWAPYLGMLRATIVENCGPASMHILSYYLFPSSYSREIHD